MTETHLHTPFFRRAARGILNSIDYDAAMDLAMRYHDEADKLSEYEDKPEVKARVRYLRYWGDQAAMLGV